jgi:SPP1 family predicted phage head-tail adaptor
VTVTIGALRHRMRLEQTDRVPDGGGGSVVSWSLITELWGSLEPLSGTEVIDADGLQGRVTHQVWLRYRSGVTPDMRLVLGPRKFDIRLVVDYGERRHHLRCLVEERVR